MSMIKIQNFTKCYGDFKAVDSINLAVNQGDVLGVLGPNGAGKTTTLRCLTGFLPITDGDITVNNISVSENAKAVKQTLGYLPESAPLYSDMIVYDYLMYIAEIRGIPAENQVSRLKELSELCGLKDVMHKEINEVSKGYKQRVGLAHAMMTDPEILILDEPTSGLDPNQIMEIRELIKHIGKEKTVIISSHILTEIEATCNRIVIINNGKIIANNTTEELKKQHQGTAIVNLEVEGVGFAELKAKLESLPEIKSIANVSSGEVTTAKIEAEQVGDIRKNIYNVIKQTDWIMLACNVETKNLETIFRELTN